MVVFYIEGMLYCPTGRLTGSVISSHCKAHQVTSLCESLVDIKILLHTPQKTSLILTNAGPCSLIDRILVIVVIEWITQQEHDARNLFLHN